MGRSHSAEAIPEPLNPLGIDGIEFIEYATSQPQAFGALLQQMGFAAVARHRSREVVLSGQGTMNLIVNAHGGDDPESKPSSDRPARPRRGRGLAPLLDLGAWEMTRASAMELNIPGIHGVGDSLVYFVDRYRDFSIYDVDFVPLASDGAEAARPGRAALVRGGAGDRRRTHARLGWISTEEPLRVLGAAAGEPTSGCYRTVRCSRAPAISSTSSSSSRRPGSDESHRDEGLVRVGLGTPRRPRRRCARSPERGDRVRRSWRRAAERSGRARAGVSRQRHVRARRRSPDEHRRLRDGHDHAGRPPRSQAACHSRDRLDPGDAKRGRHRRATREARTPQGRRSRQRAAGDGFQVLRDLEGLSGTCTPTRSTSQGHAGDVRALGSSVLLACSSTSAHATGDKASLIRVLGSWRC